MLVAKESKLLAKVAIQCCSKNTHLAARVTWKRNTGRLTRPDYPGPVFAVLQMATKIGGGPKCPTCGKTVFFNEQVQAIGKTWHKRCLKCAKCAKVLDPGKLNDREGQVYCNSCYSAVAGLKGYGLGVHSESHVSGGAAGRDVNDGVTIETGKAEIMQ